MCSVEVAASVLGAISAGCRGGRVLAARRFADCRADVAIEPLSSASGSAQGGGRSDGQRGSVR